MKRLACFLLAILLISSCSCAAEEWRSALYPEDWTPGYTDSEGRFLHDFSYAGYYLGEREIPETIKGRVADVTQAPFLADATGKTDCTQAIQSAINMVGLTGGGVVYLPEGTYRVSLNESRECALLIDKSNVLLKGAGADKTFIFCDTQDMRERQVIIVGARRDDWTVKAADEIYMLSQDVTDTPTTKIYLDRVAGLEAGDWIAIRTDWTREFIDERDVGCIWVPSADYGMTSYRRIACVDVFENAVTIDIPTRYQALTRDNARAYVITPSLENSGLMGFSVGNREYTKKSGFGAYDYENKGTAGYNVHASNLIRFAHCVNSFMVNVKSYKPACNKKDVHMLSNGLEIDSCRSLSIVDCEFSNPQYTGAGGNGYGFILSGGDCLLRDCKTQNARHGFAFKFSWSTGNVLLDFYSKESLFNSDFHMRLSVSNLIDRLTLDGDFVEAIVRPYGGQGHMHGLTTSESVFWNTRGLAYSSGKKYIIDSRQTGWGYIIGTSGKAWRVNVEPAAQILRGYGTVDTSPTDYTEGIGQGDTLVPSSLYLDQLERRLGN